MNSITQIKSSLYGAGPGTADQKQAWNDAMDLLVNATPQKLYSSTTIDFSTSLNFNGSNYYIFNCPPIKVPANWKINHWEWELSGLHPGYDLIAEEDDTYFAMFSSFNKPVNAENQLEQVHNYFNNMGSSNGSALTGSLFRNSPWACNDGNNVPYIDLLEAHVSYQEVGSTVVNNTTPYGLVHPNTWEDIGGSGFISANMNSDLAKTNTAEIKYFSTPKTIYTCFIFTDDSLDPVAKNSLDGEALTIKMEVQNYK